MKSVIILALFAFFAMSMAVPIGFYGGYGYGYGLGLGGLSYTQRIRSYTPFGVVGNAYGGIGPIFGY